MRMLGLYYCLLIFYTALHPVITGWFTILKHKNTQHSKKQKQFKCLTPSQIHSPVLSILDGTDLSVLEVSWAGK